MDVCGGRDERVEDTDRVAGRLASRHHLAPAVGDGLVDFQQPALEAKGQLISQPGIEA